MPKATILDRLAGAMETLGKREGKVLTPRQRVAAAQRWNSLADIGEGELDRLYDLSARTDRTGEIAASRYATLDYDMQDLGLKDRNSENRADNPFLSDNIDKYEEQSDFLNWCRHNGLEPNGRNLKQFRWETYQTLPKRERQWIANKAAFLGEAKFSDPEEFRNARTLRDWDAASKEYMGREWDMMDLPVYDSYEEFPDYLDYNWRY